MVQDIEAGPTTTVTAFGDRLAEAVERKRSQLLVGLDPMPELLPLELAGEAGSRPQRKPPMPAPASAAA